MIPVAPDTMTSPAMPTRPDQIPYYYHVTGSVSAYLQAITIRPISHLVWKWPEGMAFADCMANMRQGKCWCGERARHASMMFTCSVKHRALWWKQFEFWTDVRFEVQDRDKFRCVMCGSNWHLQVDHIVAIVDDGAPWDRDNLRTLCERCHAKKTGRDERRV